MVSTKLTSRKQTKYAKTFMSLIVEEEAKLIAAAIIKPTKKMLPRHLDTAEKILHWAKTN